MPPTDHRERRDIHSGRVERPPALHGQFPQTDGLGVDRAGRLDEVILVAAEEQHNRAAQVHDGGQEVRQPETDVFLRIHHADLAQDRANVDHHVEVQVDARDGGRGIDNHAVAVLESLDVGDFFAVLLGDQGRNIGPDQSVPISNGGKTPQKKRGEGLLETTGTHTHDKQTDREAGNGTIGVRNNRRQSRDDQDDMAQKGRGNGEHDGPESTPVLVSHVGTGQGHHVRPERVDYHGSASILLVSSRPGKLTQCQTSGRLLAHTQRTGIRVVISRTRGRALGKRTLDEVDD